MGAVIAGTELDEFGSTTFELTGPTAVRSAAGECGVLPNDAQVTLRSEVVIVPRVEGTTVPAAAVRTRADGTAYVITDSGEVEVTVTGSGQGIAVVDGIDPGVRVQILDGTPSTQPSPVPGDGADATGDG